MRTRKRKKKLMKDRKGKKRMDEKEKKKTREKKNRSVIMRTRKDKNGWKKKGVTVRPRKTEGKKMIENKRRKKN